MSAADFLPALRRRAIAADAAYLPNPAEHPDWRELGAGPPRVFGVDGQVWGFVAAAADCRWCAFRGSASAVDWLANLGVAFQPARTFPGRVHAGIARLAERLAEPVRAALAGLGELPLRLVGHSLGGAVAVLLHVEDDLPAAETVVFGVPRLLDRDGCHVCAGARIVRVANDGDPVPQLPPGLPFGNGYAHPGVGWRLDRDGGLHPGEAPWGPWVAEVAVALLHGSAAARRAALARRLEDHRLREYLARLSGANSLPPLREEG